METIIINNTKFEDNTALEGTDAYLYDSKYNITNLYFTGNIQSMFDGNMTILKNNTFKGKNILNKTEYTSVYMANETKK